MKTTALWTYHLAQHSLKELEGSAGLSYPRWSPDGRYIAAVRPEANNAADLYLGDLHTATRKPLVENGWIASPVWSPDSRFVYYGCADHDLDAICRIAVPDGKVEIAAASSRFHRADTSHSSFAGLTLDGSPLFMQVFKDFEVPRSIWKGDNRSGRAIDVAVFSVTRDTCRGIFAPGFSPRASRRFPVTRSANKSISSVSSIYKHSYTPTVVSLCYSLVRSQQALSRGKHI